MRIWVDYKKLPRRHMEVERKPSRYQVWINNDDPPFRKLLSWVDALICIAAWEFIPFNNDEIEKKFRKAVEREVAFWLKRYWGPESKE